MQDIDPEHWKGLWRFVHVSASALPQGPLSDELKQTSIQLILSLYSLIPCQDCREHFQSFVQSVPPSQDLKTGRDVQLWWLKCHNNVNKMLGKPEWTPQQLDLVYPPDGNYPEVSSWRPKTRPSSSAFLGLTSSKQPTPPSFTSFPDPHGYDAGKYMLNYPVVRAPPSQPQLIQRLMRQPVSRQRVQRTRTFQTPSQLVRANLRAPNRSNYATTLQNIQTQKWRAIIKQKTGVASRVLPKKKKCSSCKRRSA